MGARNIFLGLAAAGWVALAQTPVMLEVEHERVTAGDLARVIPAFSGAPPGAEILYAPAPGVAREMGSQELERLAARQGIGPGGASGGPERVRIVRRLRRLEEGEAVAALAAALAVRYRIPPEDVAIEMVGFVAPLVPAGELSFRAGESFRKGGELAAVPLTWRTPEGRSATLWLRARLTLRGRYAVVTRTLAPGTRLEPGDVAEREGALEPERWIGSASEAVGHTLARRLAAGEKIPRAFLAASRVERGAVLELRVAGGGVELRVPARAEQGGRIGDRVALRNLETGRRVTATLTGAGVAEVKR